MKKFLLRMILVATGVVAGTMSTWAQETRELLWSNDFETTPTNFTLTGKTGGRSLNPGVTDLNTFGSNVLGVGAASGDQGAMSPDLGLSSIKDLNIVDVEMLFKMDGCASGKSSGIHFVTKANNSGWLSDGTTSIFSINASSSSNGHWNTIRANGINIKDAVYQSAVKNHEFIFSETERGTTGLVKLVARLNFTNQTINFTMSRQDGTILVDNQTVAFNNQATSLYGFFIHGGKSYGGCYIDDINVYKVTNTTPTNTVTIKYTTNDGEEIPSTDLPEGTTTTYVVDNGTEFTPTYQTTFKTNDYIYTYVSGGNKITVNENTTITLVYNKTAREKVDIVLQCIDESNNILKESTLYTNIPDGDYVFYGFSKYIIDNGILYEADKNGSSYYAGKISASSDPIVINYSKVSSTETPVYFKDFGDSPSTNESSTEYLRCSGGQITSSNSKVVLVNAGELPEGYYNFDIHHFKNRSSKFNIGDVEYGTFATSSNSGVALVSHFNNVYVPANTEISATPGNSTYTDNIDYILVTKLENIPVTISTSGYSTYCPAVPLDFSTATAIEAYKATTVAGDKVSLTKVNTVAAGEGVLLRSVNGGEATESIPVIASAEKANDNKFVGTLEDIEIQQIEGDYTNYVLSNTNGVIGFYKAKGAGQSVPAGKAYLPVPTASAAKGFTLQFDGQTTGINDINAGKQDNNRCYTLSGVQVSNPQAKGIYVKNGKKVVVK